ncbi:MAG: tetratricopeptide repeat protein [Armatimonadetes bacterium]|nr:tetratricopeptide repeat protein [Armatimonadota bacterium]
MVFYKYTPALLPPETLRETFVGRDVELEEMNRILKNASSGKSPSHAILVGPKGIGKSHLLRIVYHSLKGNINVMGLGNHASSFVPVILPEEEYISTITKLLTLVIQNLEKEGIKNTPRTESESMAIRDVRERQKEIFLDFIKTFRKKTGKIIVLLVDNFDKILEGLTDEDQAILREALMTSGSILVIGSAPTIFDAIINHDRPFYNFFEIIRLDDLSFEDAVKMLKIYAGREGKTSVAETIEKSREKIENIHRLAGGNPRLLLSLYQIILDGDATIAEIIFLKMLDELTPFFNLRMNDLSPQQREIIDAMARADTLLTPTEIAQACDHPVNVVVSQLRKLEKRGYVRTTKGHGKRVIYDVREKLFSLWRRMRVEAGRRRLGLIIRFYEAWFSREELLEHLEKTIDEIGEKLHLDGVEIEFALDKLWYIKEAIPECREKSAFCVACEKKKYDVALSLIDREIREGGDDKVVVYKACIYNKMEKPDKALGILKTTSKKHPEYFNESFACLMQLGITYSLLEQFDKAVHQLEKAISLEPDEFRVWGSLGTTYVKMQRYDDAAQAFEKAVQLKPDEFLIWADLGTTYAEIKRYDEAVRAFEKAVKLKPDEFRVWSNLGITYAEIKRYDEAVRAFEKAVKLKPDEFRVWANLGITYAETKRYNEATATLEKAMKIKPDDHNALSILGEVYVNMKRYEDGEKTLKKAISHVPECDRCAKNMLAIYSAVYFEEMTEGNTETGTKGIEETLSLLDAAANKDLILAFLIGVMRSMIQKKNIGLLRIALKKIEATDNKELLEVLSPYYTIMRYLDTRDKEIIARARYEERVVIDDMLKMLEEESTSKAKSKRKDAGK